MSQILSDDAIAQRQEREREYHRGHAASMQHMLERPPQLDVLTRENRRWWNSHWFIWDLVMAHDLRGKRVLVPGCGAGEDAFAFAELGAEVYAFDISPDMVGIARARAERFGYSTIRFDAMGAEATTYPDGFFDAALFHSVFHHITIPAALRELNRVMKPDAVLIAHEQYTHSSIDGIRNSRFVDKLIYPRLQKFIYGGHKPYITEDEQKLDETELGEILSWLRDVRIEWFGLAEGRAFPTNIPWASRVDRRMMKLLGPLGPYLAGQCVFSGTWRKQA